MAITELRKLTVSYDGVNIIDELEIDDDVEIIYNGQVVVTAGEGTKTLKCNGKVMKSDIVFVAGNVTKTAKCNGKLMASDIVVLVGEFEKYNAPTITLDGSIVSTPIVEGVTMYKVYSNGSYIGYIDSDNVWHKEVSE